MRPTRILSSVHVPPATPCYGSHGPTSSMPELPSLSSRPESERQRRRSGGTCCCAVVSRVAEDFGWSAQAGHKSRGPMSRLCDRGRLSLSKGCDLTWRELVVEVKVPTPAAKSAARMGHPDSLVHLRWTVCQPPSRPGSSAAQI